MTWYDALAFARWVEQTRQRPVRLLRAAEYAQLHPGALSETEYRPCPRFGDPCEWRLAEGCVDSVLSDGTRRDRWGWIGGVEQARFRANLNWKAGAGGVPFLVNIGFGEWLFEHHESTAAAVHTVHLRGIHDGYPVERDFFPATSWGMYRCCKIGFRLCYDTSAADAQAGEAR